MNKLDQVHPVTPIVSSNRVIVSNKAMSSLLTSLNEVIDTTNLIIDKLADIDIRIGLANNDNTNTKLSLNEIREIVENNTKNIQALATAIQTISETK